MTINDNLMYFGSLTSPLLWRRYWRGKRRGRASSLPSVQVTSGRPLSKCVFSLLQKTHDRVVFEYEIVFPVLLPLPKAWRASLSVCLVWGMRLVSCQKWLQFLRFLPLPAFVVPSVEPVVFCVWWTWRKARPLWNWVNSCYSQSHCQRGLLPAQG